MSALVFRDLSGMAELRKAEALQRDVWGEGDLPDPADLMMVIQAEGGLVGGAFEGDRLLGYIFGFPTREAGVQHSHRLAVHPDARGRHLGLGLKRYQRDWCLARGIHHVRWTFDPLRAPNAALNIHRLGAESSTYFADYYGEMEGINRGIASDRLLVDWRLNSPTVAALAAGLPRPQTSGEALNQPLPPDFDAMMTNPEAANAARLAQSHALCTAFDAGRRIVDFDKERRLYILSEA